MNQWTSVDEKLPEKDGDYLVVIDMGENYVWQSVCFFERSLKTYQFITDAYDDVAQHVTHWAPLPPLPEGVISYIL